MKTNIPFHFMARILSLNLYEMWTPDARQLTFFSAPFSTKMSYANLLAFLVFIRDGKVSYQTFRKVEVSIGKKARFSFDFAS